MPLPTPTTSSSPHRIPSNQASRSGSPKRDRTPPNQLMNEACPGRLLGCGIGNALLCALVLAGCAVGPDYRRPPRTAVPAEWKVGSPWKEGQPRATEIKQGFWEIFNDAVLTGLEHEATMNSPDLRAAFQRMEESRGCPSF